jgi:hypothetical protein
MLLARSSDVVLARPAAFVLTASVWLAYAADRWLEGWRLDARLVRTPRHQFYQRHRRLVATVWAAVLGVTVVTAVAAMGFSEIVRGLLLLVPVLAYLLSHQFLHRTRRWRAPKELIVALLLTGGVAVFLWPASPRRLLPGLATFAAASFVNCALISSWERDVDRSHGQTSLALESGHAARAIRWLPWLLAIVGACLWFWIDDGRVAVACGTVSALLMGVLDRAEGRTGWAAARVLADVALLTPIAPLLWPV